MSETTVPDAAAQIATEAATRIVSLSPRVAGPHVAARAAVVALARAEWLHDPAEVAALRAVVEAARAYVPHVESGEKFDALLTTLDAAPAAAVRPIVQPGEPCAPLSELLRIDEQPEVAEQLRRDLAAIDEAERR